MAIRRMNHVMSVKNHHFWWLSSGILCSDNSPGEQVSSISNSPSHSMPLEDGPKTTRTGENCRNSSKTLTKKYQKYSRDSHDANDSCLSNVYRIHPHPSHRPKHLVNVVYNIYNLDMFPTCSQRQAKRRRICCKIASTASMSLLHRSHRWLVVDQPSEKSWSE